MTGSAPGSRPDLDWIARRGRERGTLRSAVARNPYDRELSKLIGELFTRTEATDTPSLIDKAHPAPGKPGTALVH